MRVTAATGTVGSTAGSWPGPWATARRPFRGWAGLGHGAHRTRGEHLAQPTWMASPGRRTEARRWGRGLPARNLTLRGSCNFGTHGSALTSGNHGRPGTPGAQKHVHRHPGQCAHGCRSDFRPRPWPRRRRETEAPAGPVGQCPATQVSGGTWQATWGPHTGCVLPPPGPGDTTVSQPPCPQQPWSLACGRCPGQPTVPSWP